MTEPNPGALYEFRTRVISAALRVAQARMSFELNPGDPNGDANVEYAEDVFDTHILGFADVLNRKNS